MQHMTITDIDKQVNMIISKYLGEVSDDRESIMVLFEPQKLSDDIKILAHQIYSQAKAEQREEIKERIRKLKIKVVKECKNRPDDRAFISYRNTLDQVLTLIDSDSITKEIRIRNSEANKKV